jgi:hypothetical protein
VVIQINRAAGKVGPLRLVRFWHGRYLKLLC